MIFETVQKIIARELEIDPELVQMSTDLMQDLGADSLDVVEMVGAFEEAFDIVIADEGVSDMTTVGQFVAYLESKVN